MTLTDMEYSNRKKKTKREEFLDAMDEIIPWSYWVEIIRSYAIRTFMHIDFNEQQVPDATTLLRFRHMREKNRIGEKIFADVNSRLDEAGLIMHGGTVVDASLIAAPKSTKNKTGKRDPEMHQTKKGNEWYFGMKVHAGADAGSGYVYSLTGTSANMHDVSETSNTNMKR